MDTTAADSIERQASPSASNGNPADASLECYNSIVIEPPDRSEALLRAAMFDHLDRLLQTSPDGALASAAINTFTFVQGRVRL